MGILTAGWQAERNLQSLLAWSKQVLGNILQP